MCVFRGGGSVSIRHPSSSSRGRYQVSDDDAAAGPTAQPTQINQSISPSITSDCEGLEGRHALPPHRSAAERKWQRRRTFASWGCVLLCGSEPSRFAASSITCLDRFEPPCLESPKRGQLPGAPYICTLSLGLASPFLINAQIDRSIHPIRATGRRQSIRATECVITYVQRPHQDQAHRIKSPRSPKPP